MIMCLRMHLVFLIGFFVVFSRKYLHGSEWVHPSVQRISCSECGVQVLDVFTAVALAGILGRLLTRGAVIVATSNRAPWDLNKVGSYSRPSSYDHEFMKVRTRVSAHFSTPSLYEHSVGRSRI